MTQDDGEAPPSSLDDTEYAVRLDWFAEEEAVDVCDAPAVALQLRGRLVHRDGRSLTEEQAAASLAKDPTGRHVFVVRRRRP